MEALTGKEIDPKDVRFVDLGCGFSGGHVPDWVRQGHEDAFGVDTTFSTQSKYHAEIFETVELLSVARLEASETVRRSCMLPPQNVRDFLIKIDAVLFLQKMRDASLEAICADYFLSDLSLEQRTAILREVLRTLQHPGGRLIITTPKTHIKMLREEIEAAGFVLEYSTDTFQAITPAQLLGTFNFEPLRAVMMVFCRLLR